MVMKHVEDIQNILYMILLYFCPDRPPRPVLFLRVAHGMTFGISMKYIIFIIPYKYQVC